MVTNMTERPDVFFSIIIPAYNLENYIGRAISSVLNQDFHNFELIVINDGSVDNTSVIINEYAKQHEKIIFLNHLKNESQHIVRINGVAIAKGQYILFLDGDDYYSDNALTDLYNEIQENPGYDFYEFGYLEQPARKSIFPLFLENNRFLAFFEKEEKILNAVWNKVYDSNMLKRAFSCMERLFINNAQDLYESIVIAYYAKKTKQIEKYFVNYLTGRGTSTTHKNYFQAIEFLHSFKTTSRCIKNFLILQNQNISLDNLNYRYMAFTIDTYFITQKKAEDREKLFLQLHEYFEQHIILKYLSVLKENFEITSNRLNRIVNSIPFRFYKKILKFFRKKKI